MKRIVALLMLTTIVVGCGQSPETTQSSSPQDSAVEQKPIQVAEQTAPAIPAVPYAELMSAADESVKQGDLQQALKLLSQAIQQKPDQAEAYVKRAGIFAEGKLIANAEIDMSMAIQLDPERPKYRNTRGYFRLLLKQLDKAVLDFDDAIGLDMNYAQPYNNRGLVWLGRRQPEKAVKDFENAIRVKPDYTDAHNNHGFALLQLERNEEAIESFTKTLEIDAQYLNALSNRGRAYMRVSKPELAVQDFSKIIELQPENMQFYSLRAQAYEAAGKMIEATADIQHVQWVTTLANVNRQINQKPDDAKLWVTRARHLLSESRIDDAFESFSKAVEIQKDYSDALLGRAAISYLRKNYSDVVTDCSTVLEQELSREAQSLRGDAQLALGQLDQAIEDYQNCRRFDSQLVSAYRQRAQQRRDAGDETLATADEEVAASLEKQLTESIAIKEALLPREMVIEPVSYEQVVAEEETEEMTESKSDE